MDVTASLGLSRQIILQRRLDVLANNMANLNTIGFKSNSLLVQSTANQSHQAGDADASVKPVQMAYDWSIMRDYRQGSIKNTGSPLDIAINGEGFFAVNTPNGTRYTRAGAFALNDQGSIVDMAGNELQADGSAISIPNNAKEIVIGADGTLSIDGKLQSRIRLVKFENPQALQPEGNNLFAAPDTLQPQVMADGKMTQGALEQSNVNSVYEMSNMVEISRQYQSAQNMMSDMADRQRSAIRTLGKIT